MILELKTSDGLRVKILEVKTLKIIWRLFAAFWFKAFQFSDHTIDNWEGLQQYMERRQQLGRTSNLTHKISRLGIGSWFSHLPLKAWLIPISQTVCCCHSNTVYTILPFFLLTSLFCLAGYNRYQLHILGIIQK